MGVDCRCSTAVANNRMKCPDNELSEHCTGDMGDVDGKIPLHSEGFRHRDNRFDFEAGPILWTLIFAALLAGGLIVATLYMFGVIP